MSKKSLPTIQPVSDIDHQNIDQALKLFENLFPEMGPRVGELVQIMSYLEETHVNPQLLPRVIRGINNLMLGTGQGQVIIHVKNEMTNVQVRETDSQISTKSE